MRTALILVVVASTGCGLIDTPVAESDPTPDGPLRDASALEAVSEGYAGLGAVTWLASSSSVLFVDGPVDTIWCLDPVSGSLVLFRANGGFPAGLVATPAGDLLVAETDGRRVTRTTTEGSYEIVADAVGQDRLNSPNDVEQRSDGTVYFTDPWMGPQANKMLPYQGVFRVDPAGVLFLAYEGMEAPNGILLSPDESLLYVSDSTLGRVNVFPVQADGALSTPSIFVDGLAGADGMTRDDDGNVWVAAADGIHVYAPNGSEWGMVSVPEVPTNVAFGGTDRMTLWVTGQTTLYRMNVTVAGQP